MWLIKLQIFWQKSRCIVLVFSLLNSFQAFGPHTGVEFECAKLDRATGKMDILINILSLEALSATSGEKSLAGLVTGHIKCSSFAPTHSQLQQTSGLKRLNLPTLSCTCIHSPAAASPAHHFPNGSGLTLLPLEYLMAHTSPSPALFLTQQVPESGH